MGLYCFFYLSLHNRVLNMEQTDFTEKYEALLFQIPLFRDLPLNIKHLLVDKLDFTVYAIKKMIL